MTATAVHVTVALSSHDWTTWMEAHPGTAAWLQGAGTVTVLLTALVGGGLALRRYRHDGFLPKAEARRDRDGRRAVVSVRNDGRTAGMLNAIFVELDGDEYEPQPRIRPRHPGLAFPTQLRAAHEVAVLLDADDDVFARRQIRIIAQHGSGEISPRIRRMRKGSSIGSDYYADPLPLQQVLAHSELPGGPQHESQLEMNSRAWQRNWELAESELHRLVELYDRGLISRSDLIIGRYRTVRQAQRNSGNQVVSKSAEDNP
jgi:hypothetical protein